MHELALFGLLALAVSQVGWLVADSKAFEPVRLWVKHLPLDVNRAVDTVFDVLEDWINCASCVGMWAAFLAAVILRPDFLPGNVWVSVPAYALGLALAARAIHAGIELAKRVATKEEA